MQSVTLVDATDLETWASRRDAQGLLPQILRRLIYATVDRVLRIGFPAGEGVQLGGWDGNVVVEQGNAYVPDGASAWELSTSEDIRRKADEDYAKRTDDPRGIDSAQSTFVFATPRRWPGKEEWVGARRSEGKWREVRVCDADDLEPWLQLSPAVHIWLSILLGKHPEDATDLGNFWADWSAATRPATTAEFVLSGRSDTVGSVNQWLSNPLAPLALKAESRDEALGVFAAALQELPPGDRVAHLSRAIVVRSLPAWQRLTTSTESLILVPLFDSPDAIASAVRTGHRVVIPLGQADSAAVTTVSVPPVSREEAVKSLVASGIPESRARDLAVLARKSFTSFRRRIALAPEVHQPMWSRPNEARPLVPALLAGAWDESKEADRQAVAALAQVPYEDVTPTLVRWSNEPDPPVRHVGDAWFIVSKEDAWSLLLRYVTRDDLNRLESVVIEVLGGSDPRYELPEAQRWMAGALGHTPPHSGFLREGLADTLAIMGARGETTPVAAGVSVSDYAARIVRRLFARANTDWRIWASLALVLPLLAEAAPDAFFSAVEEGLAGEEPVLSNLFTDQQSDKLFGDSPHTGLLWALETLAWNPEHLGRTAVLLAKLARFDPGGRLANRPRNSLRSIFLLWHPQTVATLDQRLSVLDMMREREPEVAWRLLCQLIPERQEVGFNTRAPRWREWAADSRHTFSRTELGRGIREVATRLIADVDEVGPHWKDLIELIAMLPEEQYEATVERLEKMDVERLQPSARSAIWDALRKLIADHRSFPDAVWALPKKHLDRLDTVFARFKPDDPIARYGWLFGNTAALPEGRKGDWQADQKALEEARLDAIHAVYARAGLPGVLELVRHVDQPGELGFTFGKSEMASAEEDELLLDHLSAEDSARAQFAHGLAAGRVQGRGSEWAEGKLAGVAGAWLPAQRAELLVCLPSGERTWDLVEAMDPETEKQYWRIVPQYGIPDQDSERAVRKLLEHGRPYAAIDLLAFLATREQSPPVALIVRALEQFLETSPGKDPVPTSFPHDVAKLLNVLEKSTEIDEQRIAALEWAFLPVLGRFERSPRLLHRELARNPGLFVEAIALVFRAEGEEPQEPTPEVEARAQRGYELLDSWRTVPGTTADGSIDADALNEWVKRAREAAAAIGRQEICDEMIGKVLSASPGGPTDTWPHPAVCAVIDRTASEALDRGFAIGIYNSRGTVRKDPLEGGTQERRLEERYANLAAAMASRWPRTAAILRRVADSYRGEALREDQRAKLREDLNVW